MLPRGAVTGAKRRIWRNALHYRRICLYLYYLRLPPYGYLFRGDALAAAPWFTTTCAPVSPAASLLYHSQEAE